MDKVTHFEIPADDLERAKTFYQGVFGWQIQQVPNYHLITTVETDEKQMPKESGAINGGMMKRDKPGEGPTIVISVSSVDESIKKIEAAGGKVVMPKIQVMDMGLYARFTDTEGNIIGIWQDLPRS